MSYLSNISRFSGSGNRGGVIQLKVARAADVVSIPDPVAGSILGDIVFSAGKGFVTWYATLETTRNTSNSRTSREGAVKSNQLNFLIPKDRAIIKAQLDQCEDDEFIVLYKDSNGNQILFGLKENPVKFQYAHDSGDGFASFNSYESKFYYDGPDNRYFYNGTVTAQPPGTAPSIVQFSTGEIIATLNPSDVLVVSSDFTHTFTQLPGSGPSGIPAVVKWDDDTPIASLQPGDVLVVETDFTFDFEIIGSI
ncbi:MAG TPA: hypothetical protein VK589_24325 [Chryseolinea sp.]|nr:hypothetical protein [Chryseolinea sp.]